MRSLRPPIFNCTMIVLISRLFTGCSSSGIPAELGVAIPRVNAVTDTSINYALYLPQHYTARSKWPVLFCFDPHADGLSPVTLFSSAAGEYGFIVAGSNTSRNGLPVAESFRIWRTIISDLRDRYNINPEAIYLAGFSGGSRVASAIAIEQGGVAGVVACGAGLPQTSAGPQKPFSYLGLVGNKDFNFSEMEEQSHLLRQSGFVNELLVFDGIHQWPPQSMVPDIFRWINLDMMRNKVIPVDRGRIDAFIDQVSAKADSLKKAGNIYEVWHQYAMLRSFLSGLTNTAPLDDELNRLEKQKPVLETKQKLMALYREEKSLREKYFPLLSSRDTGYWKSVSAFLFKRSIESPEPEEQKMYARVLAFLSMNCYLFCNNALKAGNLPEAESFIEKYRLVDPPNSEHRYMAAILSIKQGNREKAILRLQEAIGLGFNDFSRLHADPDFSSVRSDPDFKSLFSK